MKPPEWFGLFVRSAGFLITLYGMWEIVGGLENFVENILYSGDDNQTPSLGFFVFGIPSFGVGLICFFLADWIVRLAYREPTR